MNEFLGLLLVALAIYLSECLCLAPESAQAFRGRRTRWRAIDPLFELPALKKVIYATGLLPAWGGIALCERFPPPLAPAGFLPQRGDDGTSALAFGDLTADGPKVKQGPHIVFRAATAGYALRFVKLAQDLREASPMQREERIGKELDRLLNVSAAKRRRARYRRVERFLTLECRLLFAVVFIGLPALVYFRGSLAAIPAAIAAILLLIRIAWLFNRVHRILYRGEGTGRHAHIVEMMLMPLAAIRAQDRLQRELFADFHFLAVARALGTRRESRELAGLALRELEFTPASDGEEDPSTVWARRAWRDAVWRHIKQEYGEPQRLLAPPPRKSPASISYCPRCCEEYVMAQGVCQDCSGVPLRAFGKA